MRVYDIASVVGRFSGNYWMEATEFVYGDSVPGKFEKIGVVILIRSSGGYVNLGGFGREMLSKIHEEMRYLGVADGDAVKELLTHIGQMFPDISVEVMIFGLCGDEVMLSGVGAGGASLMRDGHLGKILSTTSQVNVVVGELKVGDVLVLANGGFYERLLYSDVKMLLSQGVGDGYGLASNLASNIAVLVQDVPIGSAVSALILVVSEKKEETSLVKKAKKIETLKALWRKIAGNGVYLKDRFGVDPKQRKRKRFGLLVLGVITVFLLVSLVVRARSSSMVKREEKVAEVVGPVRDLIREASEVSGVNKLRSRSLLLTAKGLLSDGLDKFPEKSEERKIVSELMSQVEVDYQKISGEIKVQPQLFLDLGLVSTGFVGGALAINSERVLVLSDNTGVVLEVEVESKKATVLAGGINNAKLVASGVGGDFVLSEEGVVRIEDSEKKTVIPKEDAWEDVVGFGVFGSNVYLLDKSVGEIWKYVPGEGEFSRRRWLAPGVQPNFDNVVDMYIDGDIWILDSGGEVRTYSGGVPKSVEMVGLSDEVVGAKSVVATESRVWILDREGKRVVGFDREGVYQLQYLWDGFGLVSDVVVAKVGDKEVMLLLSGEKIFELLL